MQLIRQNIKQIETLCEKHLVNQLYVFGSILSEKFNIESDIDFLVEFSGVDPMEYFDNYLGLKESLEFLFSRKIDLVEVQTVKNPILKRSIDRNKKMIYGRENTKVVEYFQWLVVL